jgi:hypothetical protein
VTQPTVTPAAPATVAVVTGGQYAAIRANLIGRMLTTITRLWLGLGSWHKSDVARFQRDALPVLAGTQRALGQLVAVYVSRQASVAVGTPVAPPVVPSGILTDVRKGVTLEDEYARPFEQVWWHLSQGADLPTAVDRGQDRLGSLLDLDTQVTEAVAAQAAMEATDATWWRRVPQGEKTCLLCLVASTQRYHVGELKAVHPGCDCEIQAQYTPKPADRVIDDQLLLDAYAAVKAQTGRVITSGAVLRTLLADMTDYHSELGPILVTPRGSKAERAAVTPKTPKE